MYTLLELWGNDRATAFTAQISQVRLRRRATALVFTRARCLAKFGLSSAEFKVSMVVHLYPILRATAFGICIIGFQFMLAYVHLTKWAIYSYMHGNKPAGSNCSTVLSVVFKVYTLIPPGC